MFALSPSQLLPLLAALNDDVEDTDDLKQLKSFIVIKRTKKSFIEKNSPTHQVQLFFSWFECSCSLMPTIRYLHKLHFIYQVFLAIYILYTVIVLSLFQNFNYIFLNVLVVCNKNNFEKEKEISFIFSLVDK